MARPLVIVESPTKAKTLGKFLGNAYAVTSSMGHVRDLPEHEMGIDLEHDFEPTYVVIPGRKKAVAQIKKEAKEASDIYLACDPDREGEAIAWHLAALLCGKNKQCQRVEFHEITETAVRHAFEHPRQIDQSLVNAQQARRILDRIVGYSISPILWKKVMRGLSAGRVQSVAVKVIVDREREIQKFVPQEYWTLEVTLKKYPDRVADAVDEQPFTARLDKIDGIKAELVSQDQVTGLVSELKDQSFIVRDVKISKKAKHAQPPFTTSKLQQESFNKLKYVANKTMRIAQQLYEGIELGDEGSIGLITYMRTDSVNLSKDAVAAAKDYVIGQFGKRYYPEKPNVYRSRKGAQQAHEAIRPAVPLRTPDSVKQYLNEEQYKLYKLIWDRFISSQMASAQYAVTAIEIGAGRGLFRASGARVLFDGFLKVYAVSDEDEEENRAFPKLEVEEPLQLIEFVPGQHFTKPPPRYSDASLVKALEEEGIGRPSTYAPIISTIINRDYVRRDRGYFHPTELGGMVTDLLAEHFAKIVDMKFTSEIEARLDKVEEGKMEWTQVIRKFYAKFKPEIDTAQANMRNIRKEVVPTDQVCEQCGSPMVVKWGRKGRFLSCSQFPKCRYAKAISTGVKCPQTDCPGELVERRSRRGLFYGCSTFPACRYTSDKLPETKEPEPQA